MSKYHIYTDGACSGNPGKGGWGVVVMNEDESKVFFLEHDFDGYTTNNRMELTALLCALGYAESNPKDYFIIYSDSAYVVNSYNDWMRGWAANGWRNSKKKEVENIDLMKALYGYQSRDFFNAEVRKCNGHSGVIGNEIADALATNNGAKLQDIIAYWDVSLFDEKSSMSFEFDMN